MGHLAYISQCSSTNDEVLNSIPETDFQIFGLYTLNQTRGRGQYGNRWETNPGDNIALSMVVKNQSYLNDMLINFYTAIVLRRFVANLTDYDAEIKWPNDVILKKKKISGILIEKKKIKDTEYYIVGVGINVLQNNFEHFPKAGSLYTQSGKRFDPHKVAKDFFTFFSNNLNVEINPSDVMSELNQHLFKKNEVALYGVEGTRQNGIIQQVDDEGYLWVNLEHLGLRRFFHKEIEMFY